MTRLEQVTSAYLHIGLAACYMYYKETIRHTPSGWGLDVLGNAVAQVLVWPMSAWTIYSLGRPTTLF